MKKMALLMLLMLLLSGCGQNTVHTQQTTEEEKVVYVNITAQQAKEIMDAQTGYVILDTRTQEEYDESHIPGAVLLPYDKVAEKAQTVLPDKNQQILVYCRSGRRSKIAAGALVELGYTNIKEFGGIIDWPYETE